jgi:hypothetical protein
MSSVHHHIPSFNSGEISPLMGARFGVEKVASGCRRLRNFIIHPHGPAFRRPGMEYMGDAASSSAASNLRSFQFSASTVFVLELSVVGLRVWKNGTRLSLLTPVNLPYMADELSDVQMCQINDVVYLTHPKHAPRKLIRYADNNWKIENIAWRWPALLDENPGNQALPDQYDLVSSYDLAPYLLLPEDYTSVTLSNVTGAVFTPDVDGYGMGPRRLRVERRINMSPLGEMWASVLDVTWDGNQPTTYPMVFHVPSYMDAPPGTMGPIIVTLYDDYRIYWQGQFIGIYASAGLYFTRSAGGNSYVKLLGMNLPVLPQPPEVSQVLVQGGMWKMSVNVPTQSLNHVKASRLTLQHRSSTASTWTNLYSATLNSVVNVNLTGAFAGPTYLRWQYNGFSKPLGALAKFESISMSIPYQTSIAISDITVGTGRTLTSNRPLFRSGHVGAYWQLTHRRDNAFVELVSTSPAVAATATLTLTGVAVANQTVTIGTRVYTWKSTFTATATANEVLIGANATVGCANLAAAINAGAGAGSSYSAITTAHADVTAVAVGSTVVVTARKPGTGSHFVTLNEGMTNGSWNDVFISGGVDANTTITAAETTSLRINGRWDIYTYGSWESTLYLERQNAAGNWELVRSWRANKDRNIAESGETDGDETLRLRILAGTSSESSNAAAPRFILEASDARMDGLVKITSIGTTGSSGQSVTATCEVIVPCLNTNPTYVWTEGAWSGYRGYPRAVALHENRLWFGGTDIESMRVWASVTGDIENFRRSSLDDAGLSFTPSAGELNPIQWMLSQGADLIIGTRGDEWTLSGEGKPITPTNVMFRPQSRFGSSSVAAIMASEVVVFVQRGGRKVRRISQRSNNEPWTTSDMTVLAEHIAKDGIRQLGYGSNPNAILWAVTSSGRLLGMTLESVAVVYGTDADEVWLSVKRGTRRSIERLDPKVFARDFSEYRKMIFSDCSTRYLGTPITTVTGLSRFSSKVVTVLADGVVMNGLTVSGGGILTLPNAASEIVVGLPYTSELQPSWLEVQTPKGSAQGMNWRVSRVSAYVHESEGGEVAEHPDARFEKLPYAGAGLYSGDVETVVESNTRKNIHALVRTSDPLPLNIGSLTLKLDLYGD